MQDFFNSPTVTNGINLSGILRSPQGLVQLRAGLGHEGVLRRTAFADAGLVTVGTERIHPQGRWRRDRQRPVVAARGGASAR